MLANGCDLHSDHEAQGRLDTVEQRFHATKRRPAGRDHRSEGREGEWLILLVEAPDEHVEGTMRFAAWQRRTPKSRLLRPRSGSTSGASRIRCASPCDASLEVHHRGHELASLHLAP